MTTADRILSPVAILRNSQKLPLFTAPLFPIKEMNTEMKLELQREV